MSRIVRRDGMFPGSAFSMNIATIMSITEYLQCMRYTFYMHCLI